MNWDDALFDLMALSKKNVWKYGQEKTIRWMAEQLGLKNRKGVVVADEVGMGKTRVAMAAILSTIDNGGSVVVIVPPGLISQWGREWGEFLNKLNEKRNYDPILLRSYHSIFEDSNLTFPLSKNKRRWVLMSHQFSPPRLAINSRPWQYLLPILVKALQYDDENEHRLNSYWQFVKQLYQGDEKCIGYNCEKCNNKCSQWFQMMNKASSFLRKENRWRLFSGLPKNSLFSENSKQTIKEWFDGENGRKMLMELIGPVDLLVIDEAHKNRGLSSKLESNLDLIKGNLNSKRIAITATPMELIADQWEDLFERIGERENYPSESVKSFTYAVKEAKNNPDNKDKIEYLIKASENYTRFMRPYVTRRRRIKQPEMRKLLGYGVGVVETCAHPHRDWGNIRIDLKDVEDNWKPSVVAFEALGKAAKGCSTEDKELNKLLGHLKITDSRYAAGLIPSDDVPLDMDNELDNILVKYLQDKSPKLDDRENVVRNGKLQRIIYWRKMLRRSDIRLKSHPRIQKVANEIESLVWMKGGKLTGEKILLFGTFLKPMEALWESLNMRAVLRFLDRKADGDKKEPPIPAADYYLKKIEEIWIEYEKIRSIGSVGLIRSFSSKDELVKAISLGGKRYNAIRARILKHIDKRFVKTLPGDAALASKNTIDTVSELLRNRLINDLISHGNVSDNIDLSKVKSKAFYIWCEYLKGFIDQEDEVNTNIENMTNWEIPDYLDIDPTKKEEIVELDRVADNIGENIMTEIINSEIDNISGRYGHFARQMNGDVKMYTRQILQAQFNAPDSFPYVLIAQSQIGREGLNLHKACKTVFQFHSEWNPGVIEQQIGRVDRIESMWENSAKRYRKRNPNAKVTDNGFPKISIRPVIFSGTYDDFQYNVSRYRRNSMNAHLFGELLDQDTLDRMPKGTDWDDIRDRLKKAAPDFSPEI